MERSTRRSNVTHSLLFVIAVAASGCGDEQAATAAPDAAGGDPSQPTWTRVYDEMIGAGQCDSPFCHGSAVQGGLSLVVNAAYDSLVGEPAAGTDVDGCKGKTTKLRVAPGAPEESLLVEKLTDPSCGLPMPPPPAEPLGEETVQLVRDWIAAGAKND